MRYFIRAAILFIATGLTQQTLAESHPLYELRTYTAHEGKIEELHARFRDHTLALIEKHGMKTIAYWSPADQPNKVINIVAHKSFDAAEASWQAFAADPVWIELYAATTTNGRLVANIENVFMSKTDYSP